MTRDSPNDESSRVWWIIRSLREDFTMGRECIPTCAICQDRTHHRALTKPRAKAPREKRNGRYIAHCGRRVATPTQPHART